MKFYNLGHKTFETDFSKDRPLFGTKVGPSISISLVHP